MKDRYSSDSAGCEEGGGAIAIFDARSAGLGPAEVLDAIALRLEALPPGGALKLEVGFEPAALVASLSERGLAANACECSRGVWALEVQPPGSPEIIDLRDLEAPEPLERMLEATARLAPGDSLLARLPRFPRLLLPQLAKRGLPWEIYEERDRSALVHVRKPR
jgi:hypothetical protein